MTGPALGTVVAVVVAYNRADLLSDCLDGLAAQERPLDAVVVIDNASTDDSGARARSHPIGADVHTLSRNTGGAGGFAAGLAVALQRHDADWVWLMDDDTVPTAGALRGLEDAAARYPGDSLVVMSSTAVWTDGRIHPMNTPRERLGASRQERADARAVGATAIRTASFVAFLAQGQACRAAGLPWADYFIWGDDTEYSARLLRHARGVQVRGSVVEHRTKQYGSWQAEPGPRFFNDVRNKIWGLWRTSSFHPVERVLYGIAVLKGWVGTVLRSAHRRELLGLARKGLIEGLGRRPRPTPEVLGGLGTISEDVAATEAGARR